LKLGTDVIWVSSQWFIGDGANQNPKLADYWVANLHGSYQLTKEWQIYGVINNLFNRKFATFGGECPAEGESLAESRPTLRHAFRHVYGFILHAVRGDTAAADAIFERYLAGKLSEELLAISRRCVTSDQASSCKHEIQKTGWAEQ
jgi:hypothetical protein